MGILSDPFVIIQITEFFKPLWETIWNTKVGAEEGGKNYLS